MDRLKKKDLDIYRQLRKMNAGRHVSFHMPGHKGGKGIPRYLKKGLFRNDATELCYDGRYEDLKNAINRLQDDMSVEYGCLGSFLLANGATQGIFAAFDACLDINDKILISADCHISVLNAVGLKKVRPVYIRRPFMNGRGLMEPCSYDDVELALSENPDAKALFFTYPNYYGFCADAQRLIDLAHEKGIIVIVDEAHGSHLGSSRLLPESAISCGADIIIHSMHKTLPVLTQVGSLHVNSKDLADKVEKSVRMFSTTSPSYIFAASAEFGFRYMQKSGKIELDRVINIINRLHEADGIKRVLNDDPTRMVYDVSGTGYSGFEISAMLSKRFGIFVEMADLDNIVLIVTVMNKNSDFKRLESALESIAKISRPEKEITPAICSPLAGEVANRDVMMYPPGIPLIFKGDVYPKDVAEYMQKVIMYGGEIVEC